MTDLLEAAFPYHEDFDSYAEELFYDVPGGLGNGINAVKSYYALLAAGKTPVEAYAANMQKRITPPPLQESDSPGPITAEQATLFEPVIPDPVQGMAKRALSAAGLAAT